MSETASVAVVILTFNESLHLRRAIQRVTSFAKEIVVVDSYSTDDTVEIATSLGARVIQHPFENQARQFQWALDNAPIAAEWIMRLDADEVVEPQLAEEIARRLPQLPPEVTGVVLKRKTIFLGRFIRHGGRYPLLLLRIWRRGKARVEDRWMDEHIYLTDGQSVTFQGTFADNDLRDLTSFTEKHNKYASREALAILNMRTQLFGTQMNLSGTSAPRQARLKRFLHAKIYSRLPYQLSATAYFFLRYVVQLGFMDGKEGFTYHVLQGFWYRFLVGAKLRELETAVQGAASREEARMAVVRLTRVPAAHLAEK